VTSLHNQIINQGLVKIALDTGGSIHPLIIPADKTNGTGLMNPSIYQDGDRLLVNIRHVNYTLYHSENKKFQHRYGPLQYLHPENDRHLRTWNYVAQLDHNLGVRFVHQVDTSELDVEPIWEFVGLEDARLFRWHNKLYLSGVRRDTTTNGQGRMELSEISFDPKGAREISRVRIPAPVPDVSYCEKNWMPILDQPFHYVKWSNPTEVVRYDPETHVTHTVHLDTENQIPNLPDFRGSSHVIPYGVNHYLAVIHEVNLFKSEAGEKDAVYRHRFVVWDKNWNMVRYTDSFSFMGADIEFCCGAAFVGDNLLLSFGYQDNCAFILRMPITMLDDFLRMDGVAKQFDWGKIALNPWFHRVVNAEVFVDDAYERFYPVEPGDIVLDVGASVGPFSWKISAKNPAHIYCLEPKKDLFRTLQLNMSRVTVPVTAINKGLGPKDGKNYLSGMYDANQQLISDGTNGEIVDTVSFKTLIQYHDISQIDFLKTDCEGGEYDIFTDDNREWIMHNVKKIAGEFHLNTPELKQKFRHFRDTYLRDMPTHRVLSLDYVDIKPNLWCDWFLEYYSAVNVYIDNRVPAAQKKLWNTWPAATLEVTTSVPAKGCVVDCVFCPQRTLEKVYRGKRTMTLEDFQRMIETVPREVRITFSGFIEPWMNKNCSAMVLYAHDRGHPVSVFTTGVGMSVEDAESIAHIPFAGEPNGGFTLHLPDSEMLARHPITPGYIRTLTWFRDNQHRIQNFRVMSMGADLHLDIRHLFSAPPAGTMWDRAGNLSRESLLKPDLVPLQHRWNRIEHTDGPRTCGCVEHLYHNVLLPNGDVSLCCMDYGLEHIIGNLNSQTYEQILPQSQTCYDICLHCENGAHPAAQPVLFYPSSQQ
jgi:FkbM family methyltransferase